MHERSLAESVVQVAESAARQHGGTHVSAITLEVGVLAGVEIDVLRLCFDTASRASIVKGATLIIEQPGGHAWCVPCNESVPLSSLIEPCPRCGCHRLQVTAGDQFSVREIEID